MSDDQREPTFDLQKLLSYLKQTAAPRSQLGHLVVVREAANLRGGSKAVKLLLPTQVMCRLTHLVGDIPVELTGQLDVRRLINDPESYFYILADAIDNALKDHQTRWELLFDQYACETDSQFIATSQEMGRTVFFQISVETPKFAYQTVSVGRLPLQALFRENFLIAAYEAARILPTNWKVGRHFI